MTYYDGQINHSEVMSRVSQQAKVPDTSERLESRLSVDIHRIPVELPHWTELELGKLYLTWMDSGRASALKLLYGLPTCQEVLRPLEPCLALYSTKNELDCTIGS
jgi:hypothetical protein